MTGIETALRRPERQRLTRKRIYILPTRHGCAFAATLVAMLAGATNYNNALGYAFTFLLASLALVSMLHTFANLVGLRLSGRAGAPVFAGGVARFHLQVDNRDGGERHGVVVRERRPGDEPAVQVTLPPDALAEVELPVVAAARGWLTLEDVCVATRAPLGIFRAWSIVPLGLRTLVYPRPLGDQPLPATAAESRDDHGRGGNGREDFSGLREYRPGDAPRRIHWRAAARGDALPVKLFEGTTTSDVTLRYDDVLAREPELKLCQLCRWVLEAEALGIHYGLDLAGQRLRPDAGPAHQDECLRRLALFGKNR